MNGWNVHDQDTRGERSAGVFTHEFGHAINLSHSQVNGPIVYSSYNFGIPALPGRRAAGVDAGPPPGIPRGLRSNRANPALLETMYPFIDTSATQASSRAR